MLRHGRLRTTAAPEIDAKHLDLPAIAAQYKLNPSPGDEPTVYEVLASNCNPVFFAQEGRVIISARGE